MPHLFYSFGFNSKQDKRVRSDEAAVSTYLVLPGNCCDHLPEDVVWTLLNSQLKCSALLTTALSFTSPCLPYKCAYLTLTPTTHTLPPLPPTHTLSSLLWLWIHNWEADRAFTDSPQSLLEEVCVRVSLLPAAPRGSEKNPAVCPGAPNRRWSCGASLCSRTCADTSRKPSQSSQTHFQTNNPLMWPWLPTAADSYSQSHCVKESLRSTHSCLLLLPRHPSISPPRWSVLLCKQGDHPCQR